MSRPLVEDSQKTGPQDCKLTKTFSVLRTARGGDVQKHESHMSMLEAVTAPRSHGESLEAFRARLKRDTPPPASFKAYLFLCEKNTCLQAMPTLSVWGNGCQV